MARCSVQSQVLAVVNVKFVVLWVQIGCAPVGARVVQVSCRFLLALRKPDKISVAYTGPVIV
jgi:hypothetical protein